MSIFGKFRGWRTMIFNVLAAIPVIAHLVMEALVSPELGAVIPQEWVVEYTFAVLLINGFLRVKTTTPIGRRE